MPTATYTVRRTVPRGPVDQPEPLCGSSVWLVAQRKLVTKDQTRHAAKTFRLPKLGREIQFHERFNRNGSMLMSVQPSTASSARTRPMVGANLKL